MDAGPSLNTNLNTEMSDLVHLAEEWATEEKSNSRVQEIWRSILTRAAMILLEQMGIKTLEEYDKTFGSLEKWTEAAEEIEVHRDGKAVSPVSPMTSEEFQNILKSGWPEFLDEPLLTSPFPTRRRTSMLADLIPMSPIASEASQVSPKKRTVSPKPPVQSVKKLFPTFQTPLRRRASSMPDRSLLNRSFRRETMMMTPKRTTSSPRLPTSDRETPLENRASRLRRAKLEEKLGSSFG